MKAFIQWLARTDWALPLITRIRWDSAGDLYDPITWRTYMTRFWIVKPGGLASWLLTKLTGYESIRLHHIIQPDHDRDLHSHPFKYRTFVLRGYYIEQTPGGYAVHQAGDTAKGGGYHRIFRVSKGGVWTLFCMGPNKGVPGDSGWGFLVNGKHVRREEYKTGCVRDSRWDDLL